MTFPESVKLYINKKYGDWTVISYEGKDKKSNLFYNVKCKCGFQRIANIYSLKKSPSCRSCSNENRYNFNELIGQEIGNCIVLSKVNTVRREYSKFIIKCKCGIEKIALGYKLLQGKMSSCLSCSKKKHGMTSTPEYYTWTSMLSRCLNSNRNDFKHYGGRGIKVCDRWLDFNNFFQDMGNRPKGLTLDRINNNGNYEPDNCRWSTIKEQNSNQRKRKSLNHEDKL